MFGRTEPKPNKKGRTTKPNRTDHFLSKLLAIFSQMFQLQYFLPKIDYILLIFRSLLFGNDKTLFFQNFFPQKNTWNSAKSRAFVHKMFGCVRFGFLEVFGRTTEHHRTAFFRPNTETEQMFGRSLIRPVNNIHSAEVWWAIMTQPMITKGDDIIRIFLRPIQPDIKPPMGEKIMTKNKSMEANHDASLALKFSSGRAIVA